MTVELLTATQVAEKFHRPVEWFYRRRKMLEADGFPDTVRGHGNRWHPAAVDAYLNREAGLPMVSSGSVSIPAHSLDAWRAYLDRRAEEIAADL